jgi:hypothetical protein
MTAVTFVIACLAGLGAQSPVKTVNGGTLDHIELFVASPPAAADTIVAIKPFETAKADLGTGGKDGKDARQQEAQTIQKEGPALLGNAIVATLTKLGGFKSASYASDGAEPSAGALLVEGSFTTINPGSRTKRYFAGFGAGKSEIELTGTVKDATGTTLATFRQKRVGAMGMGGGDSLDKMKSDCKNIGEDIATFLSRWAKSEKLD